MTTLLEQFDASEFEPQRYDFTYEDAPDVENLRRAIAIAQAVEDYSKTFGRPLDTAWIMRRADELLEGK